MTNRVYLCCTNFSTPPQETDWPAFGDESGMEYETAYCVPLFWLCLFGPQDVHLAPGDEGVFDIARDYAYLAFPRDEGLARLRQRSAMMRRAVGDERHALYLEWEARIAREHYSHVLVRTTELDMMEEEGRLQHDMLAALADLDAACASGTLEITPVLANLIGMPYPAEPQRYNSHVLAGTAISAEGWPPALPEPEPRLEVNGADVVVEARPWWKFW